MKRLWLGLILLLTCLLAAGLTGCRKPASSAQPSPDPTKSQALISFKDVAEERGIHFRWGPHRHRPLPILEELGCGCAFLDADNDGTLDVLLVGEGTCALFLNNGNGTFRDATHSSGLDRINGFWKGVAVGDADGDGYLDLVLTGYNTLAFLRGGPGATYRDATAESGLKPRGWSTSAGFMDLRGNGILDLVIGNYVRYDSHSPEFCRTKGVLTGCSSHVYPPQFPRLYQNDGHAHFRDVTAASGLSSAHGKTLVIGFADYDNDGRTDFYLGNDGMYADLMHNLGGLRFRNDAVREGVQVGARQVALAAMGVDWADYDRNGTPDFVVTDFSDQPFSLFSNHGAYFDVTSTQTGLAAATYKPLGFGAKFLDVDNDGWPDLVFSEGHVYDNVHDYDSTLTYREPMQLFRNLKGRTFQDISATAGPDLIRPIVGRGMATGDFDEDGRVDILVVDHEGQPMLLQNTSRQVGHWVELELRGRGQNRYAYGAQVTARSGADRWWGQVSPTSSYLSSSSPWVHFGLGVKDRLDAVDVRWPDGQRERFPCNQVDRKVRITQGQGQPDHSVGKTVQ